MLKQIADSHPLNSFDKLTKLFYSGCKTEEKIGIEFEKLPVYKDSFKAVKYSDIARFITEFKNGKWSGVYEGNNIIGLKNETGTISLEPGSQFELSLNPLENISEIKKILDRYNKETAKIGERFGISWLGYGIQPLSTNKNIKIIPKKRYEYMTHYLPTVAKRPLVMMRETAGIQTGIDYKSEEDAMRKLSLALKLSPIISGLYSNSPIRNGRLTKYKSFRALSWLQTDNDRCGLISSKIFSKDTDFSFEDYAQVLLDVPMIFIERKDIPGGTLPVKNRTFRQFIKDGYMGYKACIEDWDLHLSLYFPDVRIKSYLEIRNHDNQRSDLISSVPAFWKGIMYNTQALEEIETILKNFTCFDFQYMRSTTPKTGLNLKVKGHNLWDLASEFINISYDSLKKSGEQMYLEPVKELCEKQLTPADIIINKWENEWNHDLKKLVDYSLLK